MRTTSRIAALLSGLALTAGVIGGIPAAANADAAKPAACAQQQRQVEKAAAALARATANFAKQKKSDASTEKLAKIKKEKKAQKQRLAKATARLGECTAAQTVPAS